MRISLCTFRRAGLMGLLLLAGEAMAQADRDDRYQLPVIENEMRTYFQGLSDSEYDSLVPGPTLFPLLITIWPGLPPALSGFLSTPSPRYAPDEAVRLQSFLLSSDLGPSKRSRAIIELAESRSPLAAQLIREHMASEKDLFVLADCLKQLQALEVTGLGNSLVPLLTSTNAQVRFYAATLHARQPAAQVDLLLKQAAQEPEVMMKRRMLEAAAPRAREASFDAWLAFWRSDQPAVRLAALKPLLQFNRVHELQGELLELAGSDWEAGKVRLANALHKGLNPEFCEAMLAALSQDRSTTVRAAVATAAGDLRLPKLQPLLTLLADDSQSTVRLSVARSLARFANQEAFNTLLVLSGDADSQLIREASRQSLIALSGPFPVDVRIGAALDNANAFVRLAAYEVIATLGTDLHRQAVARQLASEQRPANIAQAILALARGDGRNASEQILTFARHESAPVRAAVAEAIGVLRITAGKPLLNEYAADDPQQLVRSPAIVAMGLLGDPQFGDTLVDILKRTRIEAPGASSETDRAIACWSIARLSEPSRAMVDRVVAMVTKPVIATQMGPMYDGDSVRVSAAWCIVDLAKRDVDLPGTDLSQLSRTVIDMLKLEDPGMDAGPMPPPASDMLRAFGAELESFFLGQPIHRAPVPAGTTTFSFATWHGRN